MTRLWRLDDARQTLVLASQDDACPRVAYWGARLPDDEDLGMLVYATELDITGGMLDTLPEVSLCPEASRSFSGQPGVSVREMDGSPLLPAFQLTEVAEREGGVTFTCQDKALGLTYRAHIDITGDTHMIVASADLAAERPVRLDWLAAPVFPASQQCEDMIDFAGRWCGEFQTVRTPWAAGTRSRDNPTGRTGHEHFPGLILPYKGARNTTGEAVAFHYGWSGGHRMIAEELPDGRRQIQFGHSLGQEREAAQAFKTAPLFAVYSPDGINGAAIAFQRHLRDHVITWPSPDAPRPVHYNCWEAVYFDHDLATLKDIATRASEIGAERFVLDDGWFGRRDNDRSSLSDWQVDTRKYPDGLGPLIEHVQNCGMSFGIWFEPEMINPDSDTYRAHPEWALGAADQVLGRHQMVLDMSLEKVRDFLFDNVSAILREHPVDYVKWDHNRALPYSDAAQTRGTYALIDRLRDTFPDVEIETCASGGARIDFGILERTHRVWLSDSNDALERLRMQHSAALFLPAAVTGSHVGPRHCHTSGRVLDISFRAWVAAQRHLGFEMDPRELTQHECDVLRRVTDWWKANRNWLFKADIHLLDSRDPSVLAEQQTAPDASRFVVFAGKAASSTQISPRPLNLTGLKGNARYSVTLLNTEDIDTLSQGRQRIKEKPVVLSGAALMQNGLTLPCSGPATLWVLEGHEVQ